MTIILDTETTELTPGHDEILQLAIIDDQKNVLFNEYLKPVRKTEWKQAESIHGISPDMVKDKKSLVDFKDQIQELMNQADTIIGYNLSFDLSFLVQAGIKLPIEAKRIDVMREFAPIYGEWNDYFCSYRWQKLETAARYYGYSGGTAHDALEDTYMTLFVYQEMDALNNKLKNFL